MKDRALVLGGGGPLGIAWETGVAAGLAEEGVDIGAADFILGTSAGAVVGAQLATDASARAMADAQIAFSRQMAASQAAPPAPPDLTPLIGFMMRFPATGEVGLDLRKELGQYSLKGATISEDAFIAQMGATGIPAAWPASFACTAVDTESGEFHVWRQGDGVELARGVASSCAVPGIYPPVAIKGRRWMDGGMRSSFSVDQAAGHSRVLAFAVIPMAMAAQRIRDRFDYEAQAVTQAGGRIELIAPDASVMDAFGPNLMDGSRRLPVVEAGIAQGKREAARIKAFWN
jgi:NTE family protein